MKNALFIPEYDFNQNSDYKLMYGPLNIFMFMTYFYSIYERVLKAKILVERKVE